MSDEELRERVTQIIDEGDLNTLTFKIIFKTLKSEFQNDLDEKKKFLRRLVQEISEEKLEREAKEEIKVVKEKKKPKKESVKEEKEVKKDIVPKKSKKKEESDEAINGVSESDRLLQEIILNNLQHGSSRQTRSNRSGPPPPLPKKKKRVKKDDDDESPKKKRATGFGKPVILSPALSEFLGEETMPRSEVVKRLHAYIKEHDLQDPKNRKRILFDEKLQEIFKVKTTDYFKMSRLISKHVMSENEI